MTSVAGVFIVVPAYNEAPRIGSVLAGLRQTWPGSQIVVVDDGSTDETAAVARRAGVVVLRHVINRDQGAALQTGTTYALRRGAQVIVHCDADGQHQPAEITEWIKPVVAGEVDVVLGSRFLGSKPVHAPLLKRLAFGLMIPLHNLVIGLRLTDLHNGVRVLSRQAAEQINITQDHKAHASEILSQIARAKLSYREVPVEILYHHYGQKLLGGSWAIARDWFKHLLFG